MNKSASAKILDAAAEDIRQTLLQKLQDDSLKIPTLPEIAVEARRMCSNENACIKDICNLIEKDPGIAARIIKVANSPLFRGNQAINNLNVAASRLGLRYTANYVTATAMQQLYQPKNSVIEGFMREVWDTSATIAACAMLIAKQDSRFNGEQAALAALTHQIGMLPLLLHAEDDPTLGKNHQLLVLVMRSIHGEIGNMILNKWDFPAEIAEVPLHYTNPDREVDEAGYSDVISVAYAKCVDTGQLSVDWLEANQFTEAHRRLSISEDLSQDEQQQLVEHIELTAAALNNKDVAA